MKLQIWCLLLAVCAIKSVFGQGATVPFKTLEAENGKLSGGAFIKIFPNITPTIATPELEASGGAYVELNQTGASVKWTNNTGINSNTLVVRVSIPDTASGGILEGTLNLYINDTFSQAITFSCRHTWFYGNGGGGLNSPDSTTITQPHKVFEDTRIVLSKPIAPGATFKLQKDTGNLAPYYRIDLVDLEDRGTPKEQPDNSLSVESYGAIADDTTDDSQAFRACIADCQSQNKTMWIPSGKFRTTGILTASGITICGAGMWYTTLEPFCPTVTSRYKWDLKNANMQDLYIKCPSTLRSQVSENMDYGMTEYGDRGWHIENVWVDNSGAAFWLSGSNGLIENCRATNTWGDGINLNNGTTSETKGLKLTAMNNYIRGSGDDGIAINAQNNQGTENNMDSCSVIYNTIIAPYWANGLRIAGGRNIIMAHNYVADVVASNGINIGRYGTGGNPLQSAQVFMNKLVRTGGYVNVQYVAGGMSVFDTAVVTNNFILNSRKAGIKLLSSYATLNGNIVDGALGIAYWIAPNVIGNAKIMNNTAANLLDSNSFYKNESSNTFPDTVFANSWQYTDTVTRFHSDSLYSGNASQALIPGSYLLSQFPQLNIANDDASSLQIPAGKKVTVFTNNNFSGRPWVFTYSIPNFSMFSPDPNNQMSSFIIEDLNNNSENVLALENVSLAAQRTTDGNVRLLWSTQSKGNGVKFIVERSIGTNNFKPIYDLWGNNTNTQYSYIDTGNMTQSVYYRIKMIKLNSIDNNMYSPIVSIGISQKNNQSISIFPNPAHNNLFIKGGPTNVLIKIISIDGHQLYSGNNTTIDVAKLIPGIYIIQIYDAANGQFLKKEKFIKQ